MSEIGPPMPRAKRICSTPGCPEVTDTGRCEGCRREAERQRGTARRRGYDRRHERTFRRGVLAKDPLCVCTDQTATDAHRHGPACLLPSTVADHHPRDKRELRRLGLDEHDPAHGRGLCKGCHDHHTALTQPGGWHRR